LLEPSTVMRQYSVIWLLLFFTHRLYAQTVIDKYSFTNTTLESSYSAHVITKLDIRLNDEKYARAVNEQLGVVGNDFLKTQVLPETSNDNDWENSLTPTNFYAVDGNKRTLCGKLFKSFEWSSKHVDDDLNIHIIGNPKNSLLSSHYTTIKNRSRNLYPYGIIEGEIDIDNRFQSFYSPANAINNIPVAVQSDVCLYGPWIEELYISSEDLNPAKDHVDVHEIHPAEQFWWVEKRPSGLRYHLNAAIDASLRFGESGWLSSNMSNTFAIAFDINLKNKSPQVFRLTSICSNHVSAIEPDGKTHYLILGLDTLIQVDEPPGSDLVSISFADVGIDPYYLLATNDSIIKGFLVISSLIQSKNRLGADGHIDQGDPVSDGNFKLFVDKKVITKALRATLVEKLITYPQERPDSITQALRPHKIKITLKKITTTINKYLGVNFDPFGLPKVLILPFKVTGYILVQKLTNFHPDSKLSRDIFENKPLILFPITPTEKANNRVILHSSGSSSRTGEEVITSTFSNSVYTIIGQSEKIYILGDFVASKGGSNIKTLELIESEPYFEIKLSLSDLKKNVPLVKEIVLHNRETIPGADYKEYKMTITFEILLED
jgi:hypothetical protein